jgi:hypothetical protein
MADEDNFDASPELQEFILLSIGMGLDNLQQEHSLLPMLLSVENDQYSMGALAVDADRVMAAAANHVASLPTATSRYALVFAGRIGVGDDLLHAVIAQAGERGALHGHNVFQTYDANTFVATGEPQYAGHADQLFGR